ncbi:hypothetical protein KC19_4G129000 [Ceratodon purpureus]|uniref:Uncharacterized protein n=1 Tax=Ceratodon purpureus TaxID=3225 RepID=A0A8T0IA31_CERPU|nr:hypothetical protein KC19_4G129000 [Ceratodon purpureus]KAG0579856.1 hypothetical protein KC19_4G129000 [Ceratodon purpureus]
MARDQKRKRTWGQFVSRKRHSYHGEYCSTSILYSKQDGSAAHFSPESFSDDTSSFSDDTSEATCDVVVDIGVEKPSSHGEYILYPYCSASILYCKQDGSVHLSPDSFCDDTREATAHLDIAVEKPDLEAYSSQDGSWWDVDILESTSQHKYLKVHYAGFPEQDDEWIPITHLRMRSRPCEFSHDYCDDIYPGIDVSVMTWHPHSYEDSEAMWFDAKVISIKRKPHSSNSCECLFRIALYEIPKNLPTDWSRRKLLPVSPEAVALKEITTMREAKDIEFEEIISASLTNTISSSPRIWVTDGKCWYSTLQSARPAFEISHGLDDDYAEYLERLLLCQPLEQEQIRPKKVGSTEPAFRKNVAVPKATAKEITYADLFFKNMELVQCDDSSENLIQDSDDESGLLPSWNPLELNRYVDPEPVPDPYEDVWEDMQAMLESTRKEEDNEKLGSSTIEESDWSCWPGEHTVEFNPALGEVCAECGLVLLGIQDMWTWDNAKRISPAEGDCDNDDDNSISDYYEFASVWDSNDDKIIEESKSEGGLLFDLVPDLAKQMQKHQKEGFLFLWRNLAGHDCNGNLCSPPIKPGGCILSHAPGTGKTFVIISFLQSYMKKNPECRPVIVAPKIMLKPWENEFRKWNIDIPVYNFDGDAAREQGKIIFHKHMAAGVVQFDVSTKKNILSVYREAMLLEWLTAPSVLLISYQTFSSLTFGDVGVGGIKTILLERPSIVVLDEGHYARNFKSRVKGQLMAIKTPLRVMLSGTLFQNNFEELYTCLNLVRPGFVKTCAQSAGLKLNVQQSDVENKRSTTQSEREAAQVAEQAARKLFIDEIGNKIDREQLAKSSPEGLAQGLKLLRRLTTPFVHHYTGGVLREQLPPLREFVIVLQPGALQKKVIAKVAERILEKNNLEREGLMSLVCIHPYLLLQHSVGKNFTDVLPQEEVMQAAMEDPEVGVKTRFVLNLLETLQHGQEKEKTLVFCVHLDPLMLLEKMLETQFGWVREQEILQIDGKVASGERQSIIERFNDPRGKARVLLLSTKACGEGITLTGASRVVFMDVLWNPAVRRQAIHRAFRIGQTKVVQVYSLVIEGSLEECKYRTMVWKDWKSQTIFHSSSEEGHENVKKSNGFWRMKKQSSKDAVLNELERQDAALDRPAFKHVFRHGGLFDDEYADDPEGEGADARDWLRGIEDDMLPSYSDSMDSDVDDGTLDMDLDTDILTTPSLVEL